MSTTMEVLSAQLDPLRSPALQQQLPGVRIAFDAETMRDYLQAALFGKANSNYTIARCDPGQSVYPGDCCIIRYQLEVDDSASGQTFEPLVIGRVFPDQATCARYMREKLAPLVERMRGREEIAPFVTPVAIIEPLNMVVYVFPIDGELPVLVDVTDRRRMREILGEMLPDALDNRLTVQDCRVELGHYGRQHRCVLRYHISGATPGADTPQQLLVYGKIAADGRGALAGPVIAALRERVLSNDGAYQFNVPRSFGFRPDLQLALFEAIPGAPQVAQLLKARLKGEEAAQPGKLTLEQSLDACARIAAALHTSGIALGRRRALDDELAGLRQGFAIVERVSPELGARFQSWLERLEGYAQETRPLNLCFSHGDFSYTQLIFDGDQSGLVDFDTICQAEPALDLGQFLAYVRVAVRKGRKGDRATATMTENLCAQFIQTYIAVVGDRLEDERRLHLRAQAYEIISLLRLALHSWQKLKGSRLEYVITILEERVSCLSQPNN
ncbi:MAG TPA: phosphotransferase [Roseiflexaceae bacterium]